MGLYEDVTIIKNVDLQDHNAMHCELVDGQFFGKKIW